ncbi:MAG: 5-formyltetrahydrofolate cyclo-ligase [Bdellovibrionales bacterium]|nr:5-formyltetrahydrofolate cyclo-ligase [Bdellovibrionales bacterium]
MRNPWPKVKDSEFSNKALLRKQNGEKLEAFFASSPHAKTLADQELGRQLKSVLLQHFFEIHPPHFLAHYRALSDEPDCYAELSQMKNLHRVYPVIRGQSLEFFEPESETAWQKSNWGFLEPNVNLAKAVDLQQCQVILVPGVAFDRRGIRLGRGQGFYDRALAQFKGKKIGLAYAVQVLEEFLPCEPHDVAMDLIITNQFIIKVKG